MSVGRWIDFWKDYKGDGYHQEDRDVMGSWQGFAIEGSNTPDFPLARGDRGKLHPRLQPVPYVGNVREATLIFAVLNPTVGPQDYEDNGRDEFHELLKANRMQENVKGCFAVDETSDAPSWFKYYRGIFRSAIETTTRDSGCKKDEVWAELKRRLAVVELVPYYSQNASMLLQNDRYASLPNVKLALEAIGEIQKRPRVKILCRWKRGPQRWQLEGGPYVLSATRRGLSATAKQAVCEHLRGYLDPELSATRK